MTAYKLIMDILGDIVASSLHDIRDLIPPSVLTEDDFDTNSKEQKATLHTRDGQVFSIVITDVTTQESTDKKPICPHCKGSGYIKGYSSYTGEQEADCWCTDTK